MSSGTLGEVVYGGSSDFVREAEWTGLLARVAQDDRAAFFDLFERMHAAVFLLAFRILHDAYLAEDAAVDAFLDIHRRAHHYEAEQTTVLAWIMNRARAVALTRRPRPVATQANRAAPDHPEVRTATLREQLMIRLAAHEGGLPGIPYFEPWTPPAWRNVAPGISCQVMAMDPERERISMFVRLEPGTDYPPHTHAGTEELHLLEGILGIDDRMLDAGEYNLAFAGTADKRVWSDTGCMCFLMTSAKDILAG